MDINVLYNTFIIGIYVDIIHFLQGNIYKLMSIIFMSLYLMF